MPETKLNLFDCPVTGRKRARTSVPWDLWKHYKSSSVIHGVYNSDTRDEIDSRHRRLINDFEAISKGQIAFSDALKLKEIIDPELHLYPGLRCGGLAARTYVPSDLTVHYESGSVSHGYYNKFTRAQINVRHRHLISEFEDFRDGRIDVPADLENLEMPDQEDFLEHIEEAHGEEASLSVTNRGFSLRTSRGIIEIGGKRLLGFFGYSVGKKGPPAKLRRDCIRSAMTIIVQDDGYTYGKPNSRTRKNHLIGNMMFLLEAARTKEKHYGHDMSTAVGMWEEDIEWVRRLPTSSHF